MSRSTGVGVAPCVDDEHAREAQGDLGHLVVVGVVHERPVLAQRELVEERLARLDDRLRSPPTPSMPEGRKTPCQWTVVATGSRLVT